MAAGHSVVVPTALLLLLLLLLLTIKMMNGAMLRPS
jgi:hypothetical protein